MLLGTALLACRGALQSVVRWGTRLGTILPPALHFIPRTHATSEILTVSSGCEYHPCNCTKQSTDGVRFMFYSASGS